MLSSFHIFPLLCLVLVSSGALHLLSNLVFVAVKLDQQHNWADEPRMQRD